MRVATLEIAPSGSRALDAGLVSAALRQRGVAAVVGEDGDTVSARVAVTPDGDLVVAVEGVISRTAPQPVLNSLAREWAADVLLDAPDLFLIGRGPDAVGAIPAAPTAREDPIRVHVILGAHAGASESLVQQLEASVTVVGAEGAWLVVPHGGGRHAWAPVQRPVVSVSSVRSGVVVEVFTAAGLAALPAQERMRGRGIPDLTLSWPARWVPVLPDDGPAGEVQRMLRRAGLAWIPELADERPVLQELGLTRTALDRVRRLENDDDLVRRLAQTFHLPEIVEDLVRGRVDIGSVPGARRLERTEWGRRARDLTTRPSLWSRLFRRGRNDEGPGDRGRAGPS